MSPKKNDAAKKKKPAEKEAWKSDSLDGAFLFLLFHKRLEHPDDFSPSELQEHPDYPFRKYSAQTFKRNCQTIANRTKKFEEKGTGLTDAFKKFIGAVLEDKPDMFGKETEDEFDDDYKDEEEEDLEEDSKLVDEESLSDHIQDPRFDPMPPTQPPIAEENITHNDKPRERKKPDEKKKPAESIAFENVSSQVVITQQRNELGKAVQLLLPNGLFFITVWVDTKLDPDILQIVIGNDGRKVLKREKKPIPSNSNELLMGMYPWAQDKNNIVVAALNAELKALKKGETGVATQWVESVLLDLPEECARNIVNLNGDPTKEIKFKTDADGRQRIAFF
jgi:hypothetical protein